jgi:hypothetical protein
MANGEGEDKWEDMDPAVWRARVVWRFLSIEKAFEQAVSDFEKKHKAAFDEISTIKKSAIWAGGSVLMMVLAAVLKKTGVI